MTVDMLVPNRVLSELEGKFIYSGQVLAQLRKDLSALETPLSPRTAMAASSELSAAAATSSAALPAIGSVSAASTSAAAAVVSPRTRTTPRKFINPTTAAQVLSPKAS
jgi:hypothetical protein